MTSSKAKELSVFAQAAISFDTDVKELERLSQQIEAALLEKESGFERAQKLLNHFTECGARVGEELKILAQQLEETRMRAEKATQVVALRAVDFRARQDKTQELLERFKGLGTAAQNLTSEIVETQKKAKEKSDQKEFLSTFIPELESRLNQLFEDTQKLRADAHFAQMKVLEQNAKVLGQNIHAAQKMLQNL